MLMCELSPIYTTFILGSALLNFGKRAVNLGHGLRHLLDKNEFDLLQCSFREGTPERKGTVPEGLDIKFRPNITRTRRSAKDQDNFSRVVQNIEVVLVKKIADTRIQKAILWVLSSRRKRNEGNETKSPSKQFFKYLNADNTAFCRLF